MIRKRNLMEIPEPQEKQSRAFEKTIALVGLMGSGKSVIGKHLAKKIRLEFFDSDQIVTKMAGITINDIFDFAGEAKFRDMEFRAIKKQLQKRPHVLATGGGAFCEPQTAKLLLNNSVVVWLQASPETLLQRIGDISSRPLLQTGQPLKVLKRLCTNREPMYKKAHIHINTDGLSIPKSVAFLQSTLDGYLSNQ